MFLTRRVSTSAASHPAGARSIPLPAGSFRRFAATRFPDPNVPTASSRAFQGGRR